MGYYIGLLSGTSMDSIDAAIVDFQQTQPRLIAHHSHPIPTELKTNLQKLCQPGENEINRMGDADVQIAECFAQAVNELLKKSNIDKNDIIAIGSHGQTIRHMPNEKHPFTLQIGDPNIIAQQTGITTVADFRRRDMAAGGQGAPLAPAFHQAIFGPIAKQQSIAIVNIGGVANVTLIEKSNVIGFDTGPGNNLADKWIWQCLEKPYDANGDWARTGNINEELLQNLKRDPYFAQPAPKSTGPEYFNLKWLNDFLKYFKLPNEDIQATLIELTASTIADNVKQADKILVCGGGVHNTLLMRRLNSLLNNNVQSTNDHGVDPDWVEAMLFAWLAKQTLEKKPIDLHNITGASEAVILGGVYF